MPDPKSADRPYDSLISADENREMFNKIAKTYDGTNRILSLGLDRWWRRKAVDRLDPQPDKLYLDVGAGTGDISLEIVRRTPTCRVVGIDRSTGMLEVGHDKVRRRNVDDRVDLIPGDTLQLQFPDNRFDGTITSFCIRNVTERKRALKEMYRVTKPGGKLVILELTHPEGIMDPLFRIYSNVVIPAFTRIACSASAYRYLTDSMEDFPKAREFANIMREAGFQNVEYTGATGGMVSILVGNVVD